MKSSRTSFLLIAGFACSLSINPSLQADTPEAILADYRKKAAPALQKVNDTLEKATLPIMADMIKSGDTEGAATLTAQLKAKKDGEPVAKPHFKAAKLFQFYDAARAKALEPIKEAAFARIEDMLKSGESKKLETLEALKNARIEIESPNFRQPTEIPTDWTYHVTPDAPATSSMRLLPDGIMEWKDGGPAGAVKMGKWKPMDGGMLIDFNDEIWNVAYNPSKRLATVERNVGTRYFKPRTKNSPLHTK